MIASWLTWLLFTQVAMVVYMLVMVTFAFEYEDKNRNKAKAEPKLLRYFRLF